MYIHSLSLTTELLKYAAFDKFWDTRPSWDGGGVWGCGWVTVWRTWELRDGNSTGEERAFNGFPKMVETRNKSYEMKEDQIPTPLISLVSRWSMKTNTVRRKGILKV